MQTIVASTRHYAEKTARIGREAGAVGLLALAFRKLAAPIAEWGGIPFFERRLDGWTPPAAGSSPDFQARQLSAADVDALREGGDPTQDVAVLTERFSRGDRAFGAVDAAGRICHVRWVATTRVHIPEIGRDIVLAPRQAYFYNGYTRPDARRCGVDGLVRNFIFATRQSEGFSRVYSYVRLDNRAGYRAASRWQQAIGRIRYIRVGRFSPWLTSMSGANPRLEGPKAQSLPENREEAWKQWFNSWLGEPLSKRSTGCAALTDDSFKSATEFIEKTLRFDRKHDVVLDVGCDSAMISRLVAPHTKRFSGVDFIPAMLKDAASLNVSTADGHPAWFTAADATNLPFRSHTFTKVYCSAMLHVLPTHEHGFRAIDELIRVTASNGVVLLSSLPDGTKRAAARLDMWKRAGWMERLSLPVRWVIPRGIKQFARRALRRPSTELPEFLHYDLPALQRSLEARGLRCEIRDFPLGYWNGEFRISLESAGSRSRRRRTPGALKDHAGCFDERRSGRTRYLSRDVPERERAQATAHPHQGRAEGVEGLTVDAGISEASGRVATAALPYGRGGQTRQLRRTDRPDLLHRPTRPLSSERGPASTASQPRARYRTRTPVLFQELAGSRSHAARLAGRYPESGMRGSTASSSSRAICSSIRAGGTPRRRWLRPSP